MKPKFFKSPEEWRAWLEKNHDTKQELLVSFRKTKTGKPSMTWSESVDEALCFGWIDGLRKSIDDESYSIRFTVRKKGSTWSKINMAKVEAMIASGKMTEQGLAKYQERKPDKQGTYSFEQAKVDFDAKFEALFMKNAKAWEFFQKQAPSYRKRAIWWVVSAVKMETRESRLEKLITVSSKSARMG